MALFDLVFGRRLATDEAEGQKVGPIEAVPVLGLDALSSAAYGPEALLTVLLPLGVAGVAWIVPIGAVVLAVLAIVYLSYRQTIAAYPNGGGSYTVAKENLGTSAGLVAAAALVVDYVLNVGVGISAGVGALVSALPALERHTLVLCLGILALLTLVNLRGVRESGLAFSLPTYGFIVLLGLVLVAGVARAVVHGGHPPPVVAPPALSGATVPVTLWLLVRAFAAGASALTGIEAVSNAVPVFRTPRRRLAERTLTLIVGVLALLLVGIGLTCRAYGIGATPPGSAGYQSVLSQLTAAVAGRGLLYGLTMASLLAVLSLSANTSYGSFPRLCRVLATDRYLPEAFARRGRRLVYTWGIAALSLFAALLLVAFGGITDRLIPLFTAGAFLAFTLSQAGMAVHFWRRRGERGRLWRVGVNAVGALATSATLAMVVVSRFVTGGWLVVVVVPLLWVAFRRVKAHHRQVRVEVELCGPLSLLGADGPPIVVVPVESWTRVAQKALRFALVLSTDVRAVQVQTREPDVADLTTRWDELVERPCRDGGLPAPRLEVLASDYREVYAPLIAYVRRLADAHPRREVAVVVPELVERRWYFLLHRHKATVLKTLLTLRGGPRVVIISTPWYLRDPDEPA